MDAAAELGRNPVSKHHIQPEYGDEQADAGWDCRTRLARPNSQARTQTGKYSFSCAADHEQDWQPYPVDPYSCYMCDHVLCVVFSSHSFWTSGLLDVPAGVTQEEGHTGILIQLLSAVRAFILSREVFSHSFPSSTMKSNFVY